MRGILWLAEEESVSQEKLCFIGKDSQFVSIVVVVVVVVVVQMLFKFLRKI